MIPAESVQRTDSEVQNKRSAKPVKFGDDSVDMLRFSFNESMSTITYGSGKSSQKINISKKEVRENEHYEIEGFSVSTDVDFLFQIGKIWAESGINVDEGIRSLNDFWLILDYFHQDMDEKIYLKMKTQAKFYIGVWYYRKSNIDATEIVLRGIMDDLEAIEGLKGARYLESHKILSRWFRDRLMYEVELIEDYFYPAY